MSDLQSVNGNSVSWGSLVCKVRDERYYRFTDISFSDKRERVKGYGMGRHHAPILRSRGKYTVENLKISGWTAAVQALRAGLAAAAPGGKSYGDVEFEVLLSYFEPDDTQIDVVFSRCVWAANSVGHSESPDPLKEEFELDCMYISRNGLVLFDQSDVVLTG